MPNTLSLSLVDKRKTVEHNFYEMGSKSNKNTKKSQTFSSKILNIMMLFFLFNWVNQNFQPVAAVTIGREKRSPFALGDITAETEPATLSKPKSSGKLKNQPKVEFIFSL